MSGVDFPISVTLAAIDRLAAPIVKMQRQVDKALLPFKHRLGEINAVAALGRELLVGPLGLPVLGHALARVGHGVAETWKGAKHAIVETTLVVAAGALAVFELVHSYAEGAVSVVRASKKLGVGAEWLQRIHYAAERSEVATDSLDSALQKFTINLGAARRGSGTAGAALFGLGVRLFDNAGKLRTIDKLLPEIADKLNHLVDPGRKQDLVRQIFGKGGAEIIPLLDKGSKGIEELMKRADRLGIVLSGEALEGAEKFEEQWKDVQGALRGSRNAIAGELIPGITTALEKFTDWQVAHQGELKKFAKQLGDDIPVGLERILKASEELYPYAVRLGNGVVWLTDKIGVANTLMLLWAATIGRELTVAIFTKLIPALFELGRALTTTAAGWTILLASADVAVWTKVALQLKSLREDAKLTWSEIGEGWIALQLRLNYDWNPIFIPLHLVADNWDEFQLIVNGKWIKIRDWLKGEFTEFRDWVKGLVSGIGDDIKHASLGGALRAEFAALRTISPTSTWLLDKLGFTEAVPKLADSLFGGDNAPSGAPIGGAQLAGKTPKAELKVSFENMPRSASVSTERNTGVDIDLSQGWSLVGP
jgi:hypothetical protein